MFWDVLFGACFNDNTQVPWLGVSFQSQVQPQEICSLPVCWCVWPSSQRLSKVWSDIVRPHNNIELSSVSYTLWSVIRFPFVLPARQMLRTLVASLLLNLTKKPIEPRSRWKVVSVLKLWSLPITRSMGIWKRGQYGSLLRPISPLVPIKVHVVIVSLSCL